MAGAGERQRVQLAFETRAGKTIATSTGGARLFEFVPSSEAGAYRQNSTLPRLIVMSRLPRDAGETSFGLRDHDEDEAMRHCAAAFRQWIGEHLGLDVDVEVLDRRKGA